jgi:hypothetical protein
MNRRSVLAALLGAPVAAKDAPNEEIARKQREFFAGLPTKPDHEALAAAQYPTPAQALHADYFDADEYLAAIDRAARRLA